MWFLPVDAGASSSRVPYPYYAISHGAGSRRWAAWAKSQWQSGSFGSPGPIRSIPRNAQFSERCKATTTPCKLTERAGKIIVSIDAFAGRSSIIEPLG